MNKQLSDNFTYKEICRCKHCGDYCIPNMVLVNALELLRKRIGLPLVINSSYRCSNHPLEINKKSKGYHTKGMAVDIQIPKGITKKAFLIIALTIDIFREGGVGVSVDGNYIHLDIRQGKHRWCYLEGKIIEYGTGLKMIGDQNQ